MSPSQILDLIAPEATVSKRVASWLQKSGCSNVDASGRDVVKAEATVEVLEAMLKVEMWHWKHAKSAKVRVAHLGALAIPDEFDGVIELISGVSELYGPSSIKPVRRAAVEATLAGPSVGNDVSAGYIIPQVLRNVYGLPSSFWVSTAASICVAEFQDDASFAQSDSTYFNQQMLEKIPSNVKIVGPYDPTNPDGESTLDVQYAYSIALNASAWFWTVDGWMLEFATDLFNAKARPLVVSMSWGWPEPKQCQIDTQQCTNSQDYVNRVNTEFMKITGTGVTLLAASGDQGAPGDSNPNCGSSKTPVSTIFPGASPWVTSVGATQLAPQKTSAPAPSVFNQPACQQYKCATSTTEQVCSYPDALITSGGGFSDYVAAPSWQSAATAAYLASGVALPPAKDFNGKNRGFPDVSALGHAYLIAIQGSLEQVDGTSCSSPVFGAIVSLLNSYRQDNKKAALGFINPLLYKLAAAVPSAFNDITTGNNKCTESCCAKYGFTATKGWDAVTGLGTPNFAPILNYIKTLP